MILPFFLFLGFMGPIPAFAIGTAPDLGVADSFSVLAFPSMTAANPTTLSGDLGLSSGLAGSKTGTWNVGGSEYFGPLSLAATARLDALNAFNDLAGQGTSGIWSLNASPVPGVWTTASSATFPGPTLTLSGDYDDVWIFQIGADFTFTGAVVMAGNAQACNVFWQVGNDATIASGSAFQGTLIAGNDVTVVSGATVNGRILSLDGALTTDNNTISGPTCQAAPPPPPPGMAELTLIKTVTNDNLGTAVATAWLLAAAGPTPISGATGSGAVTNVVVELGTYTLSESGGPAGYSGGIYSCEVDGGPAVVNNSITLADGEIAICTINNNDIAPSGGSSTVGGSLSGGVGSGGGSSSGSIGGSVGSGGGGGSSSGGGSSGSSGGGGGAVLGASIAPGVTANGTIVVAATLVPGLPKTGASPQQKNVFWSLIISTGTIAALTSLYLARRKQTN
ncbi:MAG: ice-binding family protein [bacterium]|nr:ice-binding family protein [bacterium]